MLRAITGPVLRPGGLKLTDRGLACCCMPKHARLMDVGCGAGGTVAFLRHRYGLAAGLDLSAPLLQEASQSHGGLSLVQGRAEQLPVINGCLNAVVCECVLSLCPDPRAVLEEIWRVLQPQGYLILTDLYRRDSAGDGWTSKGAVQGCLQGTVDQPTVENRIRDAGFERMLWEDHTRLLREMAAQLVWAYGSLDNFWAAVAGPPCAEPAGLQPRGGCGQPGYFLLVAQKPGL